MQYMDKGNGNHVKWFEIKMDWWLFYFPSPKRWRFNPHNGWIEQGQMGGKAGKAKRKGIKPFESLIGPIWIWSKLKKNKNPTCCKF
jgi:hypothetical protein